MAENATNGLGRAPDDGEVGASSSHAAPANGNSSAEDPDVQRVKAILTEYRAEVERIHGQGQKKSDMVAYKTLRGKLTPPPRHGHIPGVKVGDMFNGKGELAILGLHKEILRGIDAKATDPKGAYAIVMSGGYKDDADEGETFWYTGQGGQSGGKQVADQTWTGDNLALRTSYETGTPVRVFRGCMDEQKRRKYKYEGLYTVVEAVQKPSSDGPLVCSFRMVGVPSESAASVRVNYRVFGKAEAHYQMRRLASGGAARPRPKKKRKSARGGSEEVGEVVMSREELMEEIKGRPHLLVPDISNGTEALPIPVFNDVDNEQLPPDFQYISTTMFKPGVQESMTPLIQESERLMAEFKKCECGLEFHRRMVEEGPPPEPDSPEPEPPEPSTTYYNNMGLALSTEPTGGIHECWPGVCTSPECQANMVVTRGCQLPLEVFRTKDKGWGVRCRLDIPIGRFICCYAGELITEAAAEALRSKDLYLFELAQFILMHEQALSEPIPDVHKLPPIPNPATARHLLPSPPLAPHSSEPSHSAAPPTDELSSMQLVIDAAQKGNVARFINHSCGPNLIVQSVFTKDACCPLLYRVALFAIEDIPAGTELTYDYGYVKGRTAGAPRGLNCQCGSVECRGTLL